MTEQISIWDLGTSLALEAISAKARARTIARILVEEGITTDEKLDRYFKEEHSKIDKEEMEKMFISKE